ncbi:MAG TPA: hypothetical protein VIF82_13215 [Burkholderiaceae bacterium]|jgi:hypothetical protein
MPVLLILKLFLVPSFIAGITLAGRRWGATVAGSLAGFPVITGPILLFVAIEQGSQFAATAATGAMLAVLSNIGFGIAYSWACRRHSWYISLLFGWLVYFCLVALLSFVHVSPWQACLITICGLLIAAKCYPRASVDLPKAVQPGSDLVYRMLAAVVLVLALTFFSAQLGPNLTGLLSVFPVMGSVLGVFSHRHYGAGFAIKILQGMVQGFYAFTVFCLVLAYTLRTQPWLFCFLTATLVAVVIQTMLMRRRAK